MAKGVKFTMVKPKGKALHSHPFGLLGIVSGYYIRYDTLPPTGKYYGNPKSPYLLTYPNSA